MRWSKIIEHAAAFGGVFPLAPVASAAGVQVSGLRKVIAERGWWRPYPGVAALPGTPINARSRALAAAVYCGAQPPDALPPEVVERFPPRLVAVSGLTAAHLYGVQRTPPTRVDLLLPAGRMLSHADWTVTRSRALTPELVCWHDQLPLVAPALLVRHLAAYFTVGKLRAVVVDLLHAGMLRLADLEALVRGQSFQGRGKIREILASLESAERVDAPWELEVREYFASRGILFDRGQVRAPLPGPPLYFDLGILAILLLIDLHSFAFHSSPGDVERDAARTRRLAQMPDDCRYLPITWRQWHDDRDRVVEEVREVIVAQSQRHLGLPWPRPSDLVR